ncbi:hypothetical protein C6P45_004011 [Maudiozyma exigua]|uniref:Uncharacterized protein n=1 Tax=Maudiozyma exigua TaxID=34358 RepID=A0A9P7B0W9_MAUEX|nr:hypothetical protein C6P45_004011 [Kazachstania exigua]
MNAYGQWALENIHKDVELSTIKSKWVIDGTNEKNELETYTIRTLVKGQLLIISGRIPNVYIDLEKSFCKEAVENDHKTPYIMMTLFQYITYRKFHSLLCLQEDVDKKIKIINGVTPLITRYSKDYLDSQRKSIIEVSNFLSQLRKYLFILKS